MQPKALVKCMQLPGIESIYCRELQDTSPKFGTCYTVSPDLYGSSTLKELHLGSQLGLPFDSLRAMLQIPQNLRKLELSYYDDLQSGLQTDQISWLLEPVQETLEELSFEKQRGTLPAAGEPADLTALRCLKKLSFPFRYVFGKNTAGYHRNGTLLPPQLSELKAKFLPPIDEYGLIAMA